MVAQCGVDPFVPVVEVLELGHAFEFLPVLVLAVAPDLQAAARGEDQCAALADKRGLVLVAGGVGVVGQAEFCLGRGLALISIVEFDGLGREGIGLGRVGQDGLALVGVEEALGRVFDLGLDCGWAVQFRET